MSAKVKRSLKSVSSIIPCEEKTCCRTTAAEATYKCSDCGTYQCDACEAELHREDSQFSYHETERIEVDEELLCRSNACPGKNYCDVRCATCQLNYCHDCDAAYHSKAAYAGHRRVKISEVSNGSTDNAKQAPHLPREARLPQSCALAAGQASDGRSAVSTSFMLINANEELQFSSPEQFASTVCPTGPSSVKVVSIFGNTGDGKSHTLNHAFFGGTQMFATSPGSSCCTVGAWVAHNPAQSSLFIDTEGLLGVTSDNSNRRTRMLLKILAVSDVVIYRTTAGRLHADTFEFLGNASTAYKDYFLPELQAAVKRSLSTTSPASAATYTMQNLGPALVVFHETRHTNLLGGGTSEEPADVILRRHFGDCDTSAFSSIKYVGTRTVADKPTDFGLLCAAVEAELRNASVRTARPPSLVYAALQALNSRFNGDMSRPASNCFPDQYFTCLESCLACRQRCRRTMSHSTDGLPHDAPGDCKYIHAYDNKRFLCQRCYAGGKSVYVVPQMAASNEGALLGLANYALSGYVLECRNCGVIYRSRQYWYGNQEPTKEAVRTQLCHVWPGDTTLDTAGVNDNKAWKLLDGVRVVADTVTSVSAKPVRVIGDWAADKVAPAYWVPNSEILTCQKCGYTFKDTDKKHHCRSCGKGFCDTCSSRRRPVPDRGWGTDPVRVCDTCFENASPSTSTSDNGLEEGYELNHEIVARKTYENIATKLSAVATVATDYAADVIKHTARPAYWVPDSEITVCHVCRAAFGPKLMIHHCRSCGEGVCAECSPNSVPVPHRGWEQPVRVCTSCFKTLGAAHRTAHGTVP